MSAFVHFVKILLQTYGQALKLVEIDDFQVKILLYKLALHKTPHRDMSRHYTRINYSLVMFYLAVQFYLIGKDSPRPVLQNSEEYKKDTPEFTTLTS